MKRGAERVRRTAARERPDSWLAFVRRMALELRIPLAEAKAVASRMFEAAVEHAEEHGRLVVPHVGVFTRTSRKERRIRSPRTGELMTLPETKQVRFRKLTRRGTTHGEHGDAGGRCDRDAIEEDDVRH